MIRLVILLALIACTAATCQVRPTAPVADAAPDCYRAAVPSTTDTGVRWTCNAEDPACWDVLGQQVVPALADKALAGERARQACVGFIDSLRKQHVIRSAP